MFQKSNTVKQTYIPDIWLTVTVHDQHKAKMVKSYILQLSIPTVTLWDVAPSPRYYRECGPHYRGIPAVPITLQTSEVTT